MKRFVFAILLLLLFVPNAQTQDDLCNVNKLGDLISIITDLTNGAQLLVSTDPARAFEKVMEIHTEIAVFASGCYGLQFDGNTDSVIGPVQFYDGYYRVWFFTEGYGIVELETLEGTCGDAFMPLFNVTAGQATGGAQTLLQTTGCTAIIQVSNTQSAWSLTFEPLAVGLP